MIKVTENDYFGLFFLRKKGSLLNMEGYYSSLLALESFLRSDDWGLNTGYYINAIDNSVRLSYFIRPGDDLLPFVDSFISNSDFEHAKPPMQPVFKKVSNNYGRDELRFRRFLSTYSLIGLDIITSDLFNARCLFATFRFRVMASRSPYHAHFENNFQKQSTFYRSMTDGEKRQFWSDMSIYSWAHMFVNMVLGIDWNLNFCSTKERSIPEINSILLQNGIGFQIPINWKPQID